MVISTEPPAPKRGDGAEKRRRIMIAAERLFASGRFHEITLDRVAEMAGVGKGTIYRFFKDKDDLVLQVAMSGFDELCCLVEAISRENIPFGAQLSKACESISAFFATRRQLFRLMQSEDARLRLCRGPHSKEWDSRRQNLVRALAMILKRGATEGVLRRDAPAEVLAAYLMGMMRCRARDLENAPEDWRGLDSTLDLFVWGACRVDERGRRTIGDGNFPSRTSGRRGISRSR
ncbi:MAG TPA: TetR/AcrR family transcriptional regulator [Candidatus Brocadiia bacterium]|nr:TetR/AcrR family transcriptional regulator [Candidatus Brocadiia bacterium]